MNTKKNLHSPSTTEILLTLLHPFTPKYILKNLQVCFILNLEVSFNVYVCDFHSFINVIKCCMDCIFVYAYFIDC